MRQNPGGLASSIFRCLSQRHGCFQYTMVRRAFPELEWYWTCLRVARKLKLQAVPLGCLRLREGMLGFSSSPAGQLSEIPCECIPLEENHHPP